MTGDPDPATPVEQGDRADTRSAAADGAVAARADADRLETQLRYALADLDNVRRRVDRTVDRERRLERERCGRLWLPVLDNLDLALEHATGESPALEAGIDTIRSAALEAMAELGYPRIDALGRPFDPERHDAVGTMAVSGQPAGVVVAVARNGYGTDPVLRPAGVMVSAGDS